MVRFGDQLAVEQWRPWASQYVDYQLLKRKLKDITDLQKEMGTANQDVLAAQKHIFQGLLDAQIEKVLDFYKATLAGIKERLEGAKQDEEHLATSVMPADALTPEQKADSVMECVLRLREPTLDVVNLLGYVSLNMAAVRKALKKYVKNVHEALKTIPGFMALKIEHPHEPGWSMLQGTYLPQRVAADLEDMQGHQELMRLGRQIAAIYGHMKGMYLEAEGAQAHPDGEEAPSGPQRKVRRALSANYKYSASTSSYASSSDNDKDAASVLQGMDELLEKMMEAETVALRNAGLIHPLSWQEIQAGIWEAPPKDEDAVASRGGLWLNCFNSGLYMASYNLVIPTIPELCSHIGVSTVWVGLIVGCCDVATIPATMGYSIWSGHSYKMPLLASAVACLVGNMAYAFSWDTRSFALLLLARLITGFGSARTVNRRYIAVYVARKDRTWASALFVSLSAIGMALGPLLALPLQRFPPMKVWGLTLNGITMGAYVMNVAWLLFIVYAIFAFEDPLKALHKKKGQGSGLGQPLLEEQPKAEGDAVDHGKALATAELGGKGKIPDPPSGLLKGLGDPDSDDDERPLKPAAADGNAVTDVENGGVGKHKDSVDAAPAEGKPKARGCSGVWHAWLRFIHDPFMPTACCIFLCWVLKLTQQAYVDGLPIFVETLYGWTEGKCGVLLGVLGLSAPVVNLGIGSLSARVPDRIITVGSILATGLGCLALMHGAFPMSLFFVGGVAVYMGTIVMEAISMSLCSKVIDEKMSKGLWNAGLLSTQAGTIGRLCGNLVLSGCASITGSETTQQIGRLALVLFGANGFLMVFSTLFVALVYGRLIG